MISREAGCRMTGRGRGFPEAETGLGNCDMIISIGVDRPHAWGQE